MPALEVPQRAAVRESAIHGKGLFATQDIRRGDPIIEYIGEKISKEEAGERYEGQVEAGAIYLFELDDDWDLDGSIEANTARFANHSCEPNAETINEDGTIWLEATRNIKAGEEITYDYNFPLFDHKKRPCHCGAKRCRGFIVEHDGYRTLKEVYEVKGWGERFREQVEAIHAERGGGMALAKQSAIHGTGLFAVEEIEEGDPIIQYTGELVTKDEAVERYEEQVERGAIYLFDLNDEYDIDGSYEGNIAKYANHSCDPNAETINDDDEIWIEAIKDIDAGEEITYDYNFPLFDHEKRPCLCGTDKCRGFIINKRSYNYLRRKYGIEGHGARFRKALEQARSERVAARQASRQADDGEDGDGRRYAERKASRTR